LHLINSMLKHKAEERIKIEEIVDHPWINNRPIIDQYDKRKVMNKRIFTESDSKRRASTKCSVTGLWDKYFVDKSAKNSGKLPLIRTKNNEIKDSEIFEMHLKLSKQYNGKIPTYLQPIGNSKAQKNQILKIKNMVQNTDFDSIRYTDSSDYSNSNSKRKSIISNTLIVKRTSKFKPSNLSACKSIPELQQKIKKLNLY
jgi:hypothetical protein